jgi:acetyltransferase
VEKKLNMINQQLLNPKSIAVIGASNDISKPGGKVLTNIISGNFKGKLYASNPKEDEIQGIISYKDINDLPETDLAIIAIAAKYCPQTVEILAKQKNTRAFIILSAGFSETDEEGEEFENQIIKTINEVNGVLIGPNCVGVLTPNYNGAFTSPIPKLEPDGVDFISGSGATAVFIMEQGIQIGLSFASLYSVGNSAQTGVEEILEYMDITFDSEKSSKVKLLYLENINKPEKLLKHASSLINKGCRIAAVKAGSSNAGSRAASSHTGALAGSDVAVDALFKKAGIVRCFGRQELITIATIFTYPELKGKNIAVITHAGGPAVMLTDALEKSGLSVPGIDEEKGKNLLDELFAGSSVANPIDFLATGTAEQLGKIIDFCENNMPEIDGMAVIFGTPGLTRVFDAYEVINQKMKTCKKPIYPVLPSINEAKEEIAEFVSKGRTFFPEEVLLGEGLAKTFFTPKPTQIKSENIKIDIKKIRNVIDNSENGYLTPEKVQELLDAAGINRAKEMVVSNIETAKKSAKEIGYPLVMKVVGPVHKSDVGGVVLGVKTEEKMIEEFERMIQIKDTTAILLQPFLSGTELFAGAKLEDKFGHLVMAGLGGIYIEVLKDVQSSLVPVTKDEAFSMIKSLKSYKMIEGTRGQAGINQEQFVDAITKLSALLQAAPEISEMDLNPLLGTPEKVVAVDARIRIG